tara:strand:- start:1789 stop:2499 length:711 start_codon:yes stop_codon:yes gene_type:complete
MGLKKNQFLDREIVVSSKEKILEEIINFVKSKKTINIFTLNPETWKKTKQFKFGKNVFWIPESISIYYSMIFLGMKPLRVPGFDLVSFLLKHNSFNVVCWGGKKEDCHKLISNWSNLDFSSRIIGAFDGFSSNSEEVKELVNKNKDVILLVGKGAGVQEKSILEISKDLDSCISFGVGGTLDVFLGKKNRAPRFMTHFGFEYLWRVFFVPKRLIRIINSYPEFFVEVLKNKFCIRK